MRDIYVGKRESEAAGEEQPDKLRKTVLFWQEAPSAAASSDPTGALEYPASGETQDRPWSVLVQKSGHVGNDVQISALYWGGSCPFLQRRCCLFGHSSDEVASASLVGVQLPVSGPTREEHEALVAAVRRLAAALMWSRGTAVELVMTAQDEFGEHIPERIVKQTFGIAPLAGEQLIPQERLRARTVEQRVDIPMPPIMASPPVLASDKPAENPEELRIQDRGLREPLDAGDDATSVLPRNTRCPPAPGEEQWSTLQPILDGLRERPDAGDDETSVLPRAGQQAAKNPRSSPRLQGSGFLERPDTGDDASSMTGSFNQATRHVKILQKSSSSTRLLSCLS